jgi:excinuclease ABC subunit A
MCPACNGLGVDKQLVPELLVPDDSKSLLQGAVPVMQSLRSSWRRQWFESIGRHYDFDIATPWRDLPDEHRRVLLYGSGDEKIEFKFYNPRTNWSWRHTGVWKGLMDELEGRYRKLKARSLLRQFDAAMRTRACPVCHGKRLKPESLAITVGGQSIADLVALDIDSAKRFFDDLVLAEAEALIAEDALKEIRDRLAFLSYVGLHYLTLDRVAPSLSGGESQRIRLASQVGSGLVDVLYILDEPSIGLHHATPSSSSSMTSRRFAPPTSSWTSAPAPANGAGASSRGARRRRSRAAASPSRASTYRASSASPSPTRAVTAMASSSASLGRSTTTCATSPLRCRCNASSA